MNINLMPNLLDVSLCLVALFVAVRSFDIYERSRQLRLFVLGLSMTLVAISAGANFTASYVKVITLHTDWFLYIGQTIGFLFILLSLARSSDYYLQVLMRLQILIFGLLLLLLLSSFVLPDISHIVRAILGFLRFMITALIFIVYASAYIFKPSRFSLLMSGSFIFFALGYLIITYQYYQPTINQILFRNLGDTFSMIGITILVATVSID